MTLLQLKKVNEIINSLCLQIFNIFNPDTTLSLKTLNLISSTSDNSGQMKKICISIPLFQPALSRLLLPKNFFLLKNQLILVRERLLNIRKALGISHTKDMLNTMNSSNEFPFILKNIPKDIRIPIFQRVSKEANFLKNRTIRRKPTPRNQTFKLIMF